MNTASPGREVSLSEATESTTRGARVSWLEIGAETNTRTATGRVSIAARATATRIQYGRIGRTSAANYALVHETDDVKFYRVHQRLTVSSTMSPSFSPSEPRGSPLARAPESVPASLISKIRG